MKSYYIKILLLALGVLSLAILLILVGSANIPVKDLLFNLFSSANHTIIWEIRFPKMITAMLAGMTLGVVGLVMQTYFNNPLADPHILGVQGGAALGVALGIMFFGSGLDVLSETLQGLGTVFFAFVGSFVTLFILMILSKKLSSKLILLVMGLVFGHIVGGVINILMVISESSRIKNFLLWTMGSFQRVASDQLLLFTVILLTGIIFIFFFSQKLNLLLMGDRYAKSMGMDVEKIKKVLLIFTSILVATVTSFCGPIAFVGIISAHLARGGLKTSDHFILIPTCALIGAIMTLASELIASFMGDYTLPVNAILGLIGGPIIFIILIGYKKVYQT